MSERGAERGAVRSSARLSAEASGAGRASASAAGPGPQPGSSGPGASAARRARALERSREVEDSPRVLRDKCRRLARALANAKHLVVYTGAGVSTAAHIPDYRGPQGVWTRLARGEALRRVEVARATPTYTHMALSALWARGTLKFLVSQNCDGLHVRAGLPRAALAELHGDMFCEACAACRRVYVRAFDTTERTARHRHATRRLCHACGAELRDTIVHFGERGRAAWPLNWAGALRHAARADVVLCLGSSLKVLRRYPRLWRMERAPHRRPLLYIVNLQWTPKDAVAELKINARCDAVMAQLARRLRLRVPRYCPARDPLLAHAEPLAPPEAHTTSRALLVAPPSPPGSPPPSDSDEELPLRRLADRLRPLRSFHVSLQSGEATILLRAQHAPSPPPEPPPPPAEPPTAALRRFRIVRPRALNGCAAPDASKAAHDELGSKLRALLEPERCKQEEEEAGSLAAAIIRRAVLLCRASLYPGLHSMIAPPAPPDCAWCLRHFAARRCLWYGAPRLTPLTRRAWRRVRGRRYLCACCGPDKAPREQGAAPDDAGWYGKGYRKGRRQRR